MNPAYRCKILVQFPLTSILGFLVIFGFCAFWRFFIHKILSLQNPYNSSEPILVVRNYPPMFCVYTVQPSKYLQSQVLNYWTTMLAWLLKGSGHFLTFFNRMFEDIYELFNACNIIDTYFLCILYLLLALSFTWFFGYIFTSS